MKAIVFRRVDGGISIMHPVEGARLAKAITVNGKRREITPTRMDHILRKWKSENISVEWAETEDGFTYLISAQHLPRGATVLRVTDTTNIPVDRQERSAWITTNFNQR